MTETLLMTGKLLASSALLLAFYWLVLRNRASYTLARLYLLMIPFVSLMMSGLTFQVYSPKTVVWVADADVSPVTVEAPTTDDAPTTGMVQSQHSQPAATTMTATADYGWTPADEDYFQLFIQLCGVVSVVLLLIASYHFISLYRISRRLEGETTPEGFRLIHSPEVAAPCSFVKTIFMPIGMSYDKEGLILRHEKAHIRHAHFVDVWVMEMMTRLLWFNPFLWLARCELRNIHEFEADHDVLVDGADVNVYQTLLLSQAIDNGSSYANGFNHSFIRRRFVEMKRSTAGTLGRLGKIGMGVWLAVLFCGFTFTEGAAEPAELTSISQLDLAEPQMFTIEGVVDEAITDSCYNIYLADDYLDIQGETPVATVPVVDKKFRYSIPLKRMTAGRVRCIFPGGELCSAWIDIFFVPGETVTLTVHNGHYQLQPKAFSYYQKITRGVEALRRATEWTSPHLPNMAGRKWKNVKGESVGGYPPLGVKTVIFRKDETVLQLYAKDFALNGGSMIINKGAHLTDNKGNKYALKRAMDADIDETNSLTTCVFGGYYAFEPVPRDVEELNFINHDSDEGDESNAVRHIRKEVQATPGKTNFQLDITVTQGIDDSGYLIHLFNNTSGGEVPLLADIPTHNRQCSFSTYIDEPRMGQVTATFPDGSICTHCMRFPFVPGERAELTVKNGFFYLTGSKFYKEWGAADELVENARNFHKQEETDKLIKDYLTAHADEEGCVMYYLKENILPKETIMKAIPAAMLTGRFQNIIKGWYGRNID